MLVICYVVSVLIAAALMQVVIHLGMHATLAGAPGFSELTVSAFAVFNILLYM
jgi:hypothetical protein